MRARAREPVADASNLRPRVEHRRAHLYRTPLALLLLALVATMPTGPLQAQKTGQSPCGEDSEIVFARVLMGRLCQVAKEPAVFAATGAEDANQLMAALPPDIMWRVEDDVLVEFIHTYAVTLQRADAQTCANVAPEPGAAPWSQRFMAIALSVDEPTARSWADFVEAWVRARVANAPRQPEASPAQVQTLLTKYAAKLTPAERGAYLRFARQEEMEPGERCAVVRHMLEGLGSAEPAKAGPVFRALMSGRMSWLPAA